MIPKADFGHTYKRIRSTQVSMPVYYNNSLLNKNHILIKVWLAKSFTIVNYYDSSLNLEPTNTRM